MDGSADKKDSSCSTGRSSNHNPFDPANLLGQASNERSASSAFSLLGPQAMFPNALFPFAGYGDGLLPAAAATAGLASAFNSSAFGADWWRLASEQTQQLAAEGSGSSFYAGLGNPLLHHPLFSSSMEAAFGNNSFSRPPTISPHRSSPATTSGSRKSPASSRGTPATVKSPSSQNRRSSSAASKDDHETTGKTTSKSGEHSERSAISTPVSKTGGASASSLKDSNPASDNQDPFGLSLEKSLLSAEAAMQSFSPFLFPFALPPAFGGSAGLPPAFPGSALFPFSPLASAAGSLYQTPQFGAVSAPSHSAGSSGGKTTTASSSAGIYSHHHSRTNGRSGKFPPSSSATASQSRPSNHSSRKLSLDSEGRSCLNTGSVDSGSRRSNAAVDARLGHGTRPSASHHKATDDRLLGSRSSPSIDTRLKRSLAAAGFRGHDGSGTNAMVSKSTASEADDLPIDLSMKKPRHASPPPPVLKPIEPLPSSLTTSTSSGRSDNKHRSTADVLSSLAQSHQAYAEQAALAQLLSGQSGGDLYQSLAAALFPPMYDGLTGLFYPSSALAAMAMASGTADGVMTGSTAPSATSNVSTDCHGRGRGRRRGRGGRRPSSSMFISNLMPTQQSSSGATERDRREDTGSKSAAVAGQPRRSPGRGRTGSPGVSGASARTTQTVSRADSHENQGGLSDMSQLHQEMLAKMLAQSFLPSAAVAAVASAGAAGSAGTHSSSAGGTVPTTGSDSSTSRRESLSAKLLHHQSKLALALGDGSTSQSAGGAVTVTGTWNVPTASSKTSAYCNGYAAEVDSSMHTDSDASSDVSTEATASDIESTVDGISAYGSDAANSAASVGNNRKRLAPNGMLMRGDKRPKLSTAATSATSLHIPLERGWQRDTLVNSSSLDRFAGKVTYITPCGTRLRDDKEVQAFLAKHGISELTLNNFSFSTLINIGRFYRQITAADGTISYLPMTPTEIIDHFEGRLLPLTSQQLEDHLKCAADASLALSRATSQASLELSEQRKLTRQQDKLERQMLSSSASQNSLVKLAEANISGTSSSTAAVPSTTLTTTPSSSSLAGSEGTDGSGVNMHYYSYLLQAAQQQKEQQQEQHKRLMAVVAMERERRRQDALLAKAAETRRKEAEKERLREEKRLAKKLEQERKLAQKRLELFLARELRRPVEDMCILDSKPLPQLERIPGVRLSGQAFANCLSVLEFAHNYGSTLGIESELIPSMEILQHGLLNEETDGHVEHFMLFITRLVKLALDDPGISNVKECATMSGQKLADVELSSANISEVLRIFIKSRNGRDDEMTGWLSSIPFQSLQPTQKSAILAFLCNELLGSKSVTGEIEKNMELVNNLNRDKFLIEAKLKRLRAQQTRYQRMASVTSKTEVASVASGAVQSEDSNATSAVTAAGVTVDSDSDVMSRPDVTAAGLQDSDAEDEKKSSAEEVDGKVDKVVKQLNQLVDRMTKASHKLSAISLGQDRYRRRYWILPRFGGILVEGLESGEPESATDPVLNPPETPYPVETESKHNFSGLLPKVESNGNVSDVVNKTESVVDCVALADGLAFGENTFENKLVTSDDIELAEGPEVKCEPAVTDNQCSAIVDAPSASTVTADAEQLPVGESNTSEGLAMKVEQNVTTSEDLPVKSEPNAEKCLEMENDAKMEPEDFKLEAKSEDKDLTGNGTNAVETESMFTFPDTISSECAVKSDFKPIPVDALPQAPQAQLSRMSSFSQQDAEFSMGGNSEAATMDCSMMSGLITPVETPFSEADTPFPDKSMCSTPASCVLMSRTSTPSMLPSSMFIDDLLSTPSAADAELEPDYLAIPRNVQAIPTDLRRGWWRLTNPETIRELLASLNSRGVRERLLQKTLEKHMEYVCQLCTKQKKNALKLTVSDESNDTATPAAEGSSASVTSVDCDETCDRKLQRTIELQVLKDVENMEERVCTASLQGWKIPSHEKLPEGIELVCKYTETLTENQRYILEVTRERLMFLEHNIERRYLKPPFSQGHQLSLAAMSASNNSSNARDGGSSSEEDSDEDEETPTKELLMWRSAVSMATSAAQLCLYTMQLNRAVAWEKSIMKVLCQICCEDTNEAELLLCDICDRGYHTYCIRPKVSCIPEGDWYCYECISRASGETCCAVCGQQGVRLATCEHCRRRIHLDCMDPPIARQPKKWSCNSCAAEKGKVVRKRNRRRSSSVTTVIKDCDKETTTNSQQSTCDMENNSVQSSETPADDQQSALTTDSALESDQNLAEMMVDGLPAVVLPADMESVVEREREREREGLEMETAETASQEAGGGSVEENQTTFNGGNITANVLSAVPVEQDMTVCRNILSELRKHGDAWPFQAPVSSKQFPTYRKVIECPMDFKTISRKLKNNNYKTPEEFAADIRLMFANCEKFNEDDSSVGRAGHSLQEFFESRWTELNSVTDSDDAR